MDHIKTLIAWAMIGSLFFCSSSVSGFMKADSQKQTGETPGKSIGITNKIKRATELMQKIEKGVLYTDKNQYDLTGAKIIDHAEGNKVREFAGGRKRVVEMIFVNDKLKEVIIHQ